MTMRIKQITSVVLAMGLMFMVACKGKPKDGDIQAAVSSSLTTPGVTVDVKDGTVTLSGQVASESDKAAAETTAKANKDVKSVTNNITVAPAPAATQPAVAVTADDALKTAVSAVAKDYPGITTDVKDGIITVTGTETAVKWKKLKMALDALKPKKVDASGLKVK
jgi:hyperosmotically inducible protein